MQCPRCQHQNPSQAKFCEECATPLVRTCANCGTPVSPGRYCEGESLDGKGRFSFRAFEPLGQPPYLGSARPDSAAQVEQMADAPQTNSLAPA